jgi:hypothetical protein
MERWMRMMLGGTLKECNVDQWSGTGTARDGCFCDAFAMPLRAGEGQNSSAVLIWPEKFGG